MNVKSSDANTLLIIHFSPEYIVFNDRIFHNTTGKGMKGVIVAAHSVIKSSH